VRTTILKITDNLKNYLIERNLLEKVEYNAKIHTYIDDDRTHEYINTIFVWHNTDEDEFFWKDIHEDYKKILKRKQKLERICQEK
jgi:hypothetical protein